MAKHGASRHARRHASVRTKPDPANRAHCPTTPRQRLMATHQDTPSLGHAPSQRHLVSRRLYRPCAMVALYPSLSQRDLPTCSDSPGSTHAVAPHRARRETTPRQFDQLCNWAPSTMPRLPPTPRPPPRPTTRCAAHCVANAVPTSCRSVSTIAIASPEGWYSDYGGSPPPTHRTRTKSYTPGSTKCRFSTTPAFDCGWIPTPPVRTEGTQLHATLVTGG